MRKAQRSPVSGERERVNAPAAKRATGRALPEWARQALAFVEPLPTRGATKPSPTRLARHAALVTKVRNAWPELCKVVVPEFDRLCLDVVRARIFVSVLNLLEYRGDGAHYVARRNAQREADRLAQAIAAKAGELAHLLRLRGGLMGTWKLAGRNPQPCRLPGPVVCRRRQGAGVRRNRRTGLEIPERINRVCPVIAGSVATARSRATVAQVYSGRFCARLCRSSTLLNLHKLGAPVGFHFSDAAVADLHTILFRKATDTAGTGADSVRKLRAPSG